jgi:hypothetical protein
MASNNRAMLTRLKRELEMLSVDPPHGIAVWPKQDSMNSLEARFVLFLVCNS